MLILSDLINIPIVIGMLLETKSRQAARIIQKSESFIYIKQWSRARNVILALLTSQTEISQYEQHLQI